MKIAPEKNTTKKEAEDFLKQEFDVEDYYSNSYEERLGKTPMEEESVLGIWEGNRGESKFIPNSETLGGKAALDKLSEKGLDGIEYKNAEPDFSKCSEATVRIDDMTQDRVKNFEQADEKCSEKWNAEAKGGRNDWTDRLVQDWRHKNKYSWHERCDTRTMDLVPYEIHNQCIHSGGVSICRVRDLGIIGGEFDE